MPAEGGGDDALFGDLGGRHSAEVTGRDVVGMALSATGLFKDPLFVPVEFAEVVGEENPGQKCRRARTAAHAEGNFIMQLKVKSRGEMTGLREHIDVPVRESLIVELYSK